MPDRTIGDRLHHLQTVGRGTRRIEQGERRRLGVESVERRGLARLPAARMLVAGHQQRERRMLGIGQIAPPDLEQTDAVGAAVLIARRGGKQPGQQRRPHDLQILADRIGERPGAAAEGRRFAFGDEGPGHRLVESRRRCAPAQAPFDQLLGGCGRPGDAVGAGQGDRCDGVETRDPRHFLDHVGRGIHVAAPARHRNLPRRAFGDAEAQSLKDRALPRRVDRDPAERRRQRGIIGDRLRLDRRLARARYPRGRATTDIEDISGDDRGRIVEECGIDAAFEPAARIAGEAERLPGQRDPLGREISDLEQHVGRRFAAPAMLAAHDTGDVVDAAVVADHGHAVGQHIVLAVERCHRFAIARAARNERAVQRCAIVNMARPAEVEHHVVGDVDQRRNRTLPHRFEPPPHPFRSGAIGDAADRATEKGRAAFGVVGTDRGGRGVFARDDGDVERLQRAEPGGGEVARDAAHAHAILPVGGDRNVDHRIGCARIIGEGGADRRVCGQFDNAVMIVAEFEFARRTHHAVRRDAADRRDLELHAVCRHHRAGQPEHTDQSRAGVGCTAHDLERGAVAGIDRQHLQLVGLGVPFGGQHLGDAKARELLGGILDALDFEPDAVERRDDIVDGRIGFEMRLQPFEGDLHAEIPPLRVGTFSAPNP